MYYSNNNNNNNNNETNLFVTAGGRGEFLVTFGRVSVRLGPGGRERKERRGKEGRTEREREREITINAEQVNFIWPNFRCELN